MINMKMKFALLLALSFNILPAFPGTESGGGGGVVIINNKPVLMDVFTILNHDDTLPNLGEPSYIQETQTLSISKENRDKILKSNNAFKTATQIVEKWLKLDMGTMNTVVNVSMLQPLRWSFVDHEVEAPPFYLAQGLPINAKTEVAAYYHFYDQKNVEVQINRLKWNEMDLLSQSGLILHETLRQVQIGLQGRFDDEALQRVTALYTLCKPVRRLNYYMFYLLANSPERADKIYGDFNSLVQTECKGI